jgi:serine/threonine protein kinase
MDLTDVSPLTVVECPGCGSPQTVFQRFGPFQLERLVGTGGMGAVYKATDIALHRPIALKVLQKKLSHDQTLTAQFEREAALTARINHPHVVRVYSTGSAHGMFYIAMELVDQGSLDGHMEEFGRLPEEDVLRIGIQVAEGLQAADKAGLIHRDIKPGNILFSHQRQAKIVDFGLALQSNMAHSHAGEIWGTPYYISPEALAFKPEDFRSDMYALGASLWHALTGEPPHMSSSVSVHELLHLKKKPVALLTVYPEAHPLTATAFNRTLSHNPDERFRDYGEFIAALQEALDGLQSRGAQVSRKTTSKKLGVLVLGILLAMLGGAWWWWHPTLSNSENTPIVEPSFQSDGERLSHSLALLSKPGQLELAIRRLELIASSPGLTPDLQVWTHLSLGIAHELQGNASNAATAVNRALELASETDPELKAFATRWSEKLPSGKQIPGANSQSWEVAEQLWVGLNALNKLNLADANAAFNKAASPRTNPADHLKDLTPLAKQLILEVQNYQTLQNELDAAAKTEERALHLRRAEELVQTMQPAVFLRARAGELLAKAKSASARVAEIKPAQSPAKEAAPLTRVPATSPEQKALHSPSPSPSPVTLERVEALRTQVLPLAQSFNFKDALRESAKFNPSSELERNAVISVQRQLNTANALFLWAIQEINKGGTLPSPILRNGSAFKSDPIKADEQKILASAFAGTPPVPIPWTDISPIYLIKLVQFRLSTLPNHPQRAELLWGAGNIHLILGSRQNARPFLEEAARLNPAYAELVTGILAGK